MKEKLPGREGAEEEGEGNKSFPASCLEESGEPASGSEELGPQPMGDGRKEVKTLFSFSSIFGAAGGEAETAKQPGFSLLLPHGTEIRKALFPQTLLHG